MIAVSFLTTADRGEITETANSLSVLLCTLCCKLVFLGSKNSSFAIVRVKVLQKNGKIKPTTIVVFIFIKDEVKVIRNTNDKISCFR